METLLLVFVIITLLLSMVAVALSLLSLKKKQNVSSFDEEKLKKDIADTIKVENSMLTGAVNAQNKASKDMQDSVEKRIDNFVQSTDNKLEILRQTNERNLKEVRDQNAATLKEVRDEMDKTIRMVVDSNDKALTAIRVENAEELKQVKEVVQTKLESTLTQQFGNSFNMVNQRMQEIYVAFNELKGLQNDVNDLNKVFKNVKTRGTWGEVSLENLLSQILTEDQYVKQAQLGKSDNEATRVDFAIKLPGKGDGTVYLPIDAKFPIEDYQRLVDASTAGNAEDVERYAKALGDAVVKQARSIRDKYINSKTTDFAVMYLPIEGLYAEIVKRTELLDKLQYECKVVVCGPTTLSALLNSLRMGFKSVAIEKNSQQIKKLLEQFQKDFAKFSEYLGQLKQRIMKVQNSIENAEKRSNTIGTKLQKVSKLDLGDDGITMLEGLPSMEELEADDDIIGENEDDND